MTEENIAYFDNAATTFPKPDEVYSFMDSFYRNCGINIGRSGSTLSQSAASLQNQTRELILELFHCKGKTVIFEPSATIALNQVIRGLDWKDGDTVYITPFEHNAVLRPLNYLKEQYNLNIIELAVDRETISYNLEKIKYQFQENPPKIVIATHASNVCGVVAPIEKIFPLAKKYNAITIADMSQSAGLIDTNLIEVMADFAIFAGHKTLYGPFGIAGFVATSNIELQPIIYGGTGIESADPFMPRRVPIRYEAGSQNIQAIAGLYSALKWINKTGIDNIYKKEYDITQNILDVLNKYSFIKTYRSLDKSIGVISFNVIGYSPDSLNDIIQKRIVCRTGLQCAPNAHKFLGTFPAGTIRISTNYFNSRIDVCILDELLQEISLNI